MEAFAYRPCLEWWFAAFDGTGAAAENGVHKEKEWWIVTDEDIREMTDATERDCPPTAGTSGAEA